MQIVGKIARDTIKEIEKERTLHRQERRWLLDYAFATRNAILAVPVDRREDFTRNYINAIESFNAFYASDSRPGDIYLGDYLVTLTKNLLNVD